MTDNPTPAPAPDAELNDDQLEAVAGGNWIVDALVDAAVDAVKKLVPSGPTV